MDTPQYDELLKAVAFLRQFPGAKKELDYTLYSIKILDFVLSDSFQNGKLRKTEGKFAKHQGLLMLGMSGYLTQVVLKNTNNTKVEIDPTDEKWYLHYKLVGETGFTIQPAQLILKKAQEGYTASLHPIILSSIPNFDHPKDDLLPLQTDMSGTATKPWWKLW